MKKKQSFIALFVLLAMVFNACGDHSGSSASFSTPTGFYVDSSGNVAETDSGRTVAVADDKAKVVFYSDNLASSAQRVGFAYEGKTMIFLFENSKNFPTSMVLSESGTSYKGTFTPYDSAGQTYSLTLENGGDSATLSNIALSKDIFTQHKDNSKLTASQNLRMRNLHIAMCIYKSLDGFLASDNNRQVRGIWIGVDKLMQKFFPGPVTSIVVGTIAFGVGAANFMSENPLAMASGLSAINDGAKLLITGMNQAFGGGATFVAVTGITDVPTTALIGTLALSGTVAPTNATNKAIVWSLKSPGTTGAKISGSTLTTTAAGTVIVTGTIANGKAVGTPYTQDFSIAITNTSNFVAVTGITGVPSGSAIGSLTLSASVEPSNATNKTIVWSIKSSGTTGATLSGSTLKTTAAGTVTVTGTIANGKAVGTPYTQDFPITITTTNTFIAVTGIYDVPTTASVGNLTLSGSVEPYNATNKTIVWSVKSPGTTGATISGNTLATTAAGTVTVTATIANGMAAGTPYTQDFSITVTSPSGGGAKPNTPTGLSVESMYPDYGRPWFVISWNIVPEAYNGNNGDTGYRLYRSLSASGPYNYSVYLLFFSSENNGRCSGFDWDEDVEALTTYYYKVSAVNDYGESPQSSAVASDYLLMPPRRSPDTVTATAISSTEITISWNAVPGATYYQVSRRTSTGGYIMNPMETDGTSFTDSGLSPNTTYKYYVIAANPYGSCSSIPYSINSMPTATTFP